MRNPKKIKPLLALSFFNLSELYQGFYSVLYNESILFEYALRNIADAIPVRVGGHEIRWVDFNIEISSALDKYFTEEVKSLEGIYGEWTKDIDHDWKVSADGEWMREVKTKKPVRDEADSDEDGKPYVSWFEYHQPEDEEIKDAIIKDNQTFLGHKNCKAKLAQEAIHYSQDLGIDYMKKMELRTAILRQLFIGKSIKDSKLLPLLAKAKTILGKEEVKFLRPTYLPKLLSKPIKKQISKAEQRLERDREIEEGYLNDEDSE